MLRIWRQAFPVLFCLLNQLRIDLFKLGQEAWFFLKTHHFIGKLSILEDEHRWIIGDIVFGLGYIVMIHIYKPECHLSLKFIGKISYSHIHGTTPLAPRCWSIYHKERISLYRWIQSLSLIGIGFEGLFSPKRVIGTAIDGKPKAETVLSWTLLVFRPGLSSFRSATRSDLDILPLILFNRSPSLNKSNVG